MLWSSSVRYGQKNQVVFNDNMISQVSAARQGFKQLDIRRDNGSVSSVGLIPAACNPWLRWWPLSKLARLSASLLVLQGEACSFSALCRQMSISPKHTWGHCAFLGYLGSCLGI